jgi:predicted metal-binding membrane protein
LALAWVSTLRSAMGMPPSPGTMGRGFVGFLLLWTLMMAAMMLPSVAPTVSLYLRSLRGRTSGLTLVLRSAGLVVGYLAVWSLFGVLAFVAALAGSVLAAEAPNAAPWVAALLLAAAGIYQLTPLKDRCLRHCRSPLGFLLHFGNYRGRLRDLRVGFYHGAYCVACCWGLMVVLITVGVMNLPWMVGLAAVIFIDEDLAVWQGLQRCIWHCAHCVRLLRAMARQPRFRSVHDRKYVTRTSEFSHAAERASRSHGEVAPMIACSRETAGRSHVPRLGVVSASSFRVERGQA